jgi:hypothetical protein
MVNGKRCKVYVDGRIIGDEPIPDSLFRAVDVILAELPDPAEPS